MTEVTADEVADWLDESADYLEEKGWCREEIALTSGEVCAVGAIRRYVRMSKYGTADDRYIGNTLTDIAEDILGRYVKSGVPVWNDEEARDMYEVSDAMRHAAKDIRNGEIEL